MERVESSFYRIGGRSRLTIAAVNDESGSFFDRLPLFQSWVWKIITAVGAVSFLLGIVIGVWAYLSLAK